MHVLTMNKLNKKESVMCNSTKSYKIQILYRLE